MPMSEYSTKSGPVADVHLDGRDLAVMPMSGRSDLVEEARTSERSEWCLTPSPPASLHDWWIVAVSDLIQDEQGLGVTTQSGLLEPVEACVGAER